MLADFIASNRAAIVDSARARVATRTSPKPTREELANGIPVFLEQLTTALRIAELTRVNAHDELVLSAGRHGSDLFRMGLTIAQVVHVYGDVCQVITELAGQHKALISAAEFQTLNLCLDEAIAEAVTEFARQRERAITDQGTERLGMFAHELRNLLNAASLSFESISSGRVAPGGSTALVHQRSLIGLRDLIDRSLADVRLNAGLQHVERIFVGEFLEEVEIGALMQARARGAQFVLKTVHANVAIHADRALIAAVISNFLQNAFKFTHKGGTITLSARVFGNSIFFDVEDECGGLPPGKSEDLFRPFEQRSADRRGLGLGLTICQRAAQAHAGKIHIRNLPGKGCVFTLELPREADADCDAPRRRAGA